MSEELRNKEKNMVENENTEGFHFLDVLTLFVRQKKILFTVPLITGIAATVVAFMITPTFSSMAVILPPQQQSSGVAAMLGQLGGLAGAAGNIAGLKNSNDLYVAMLRSRTIADKLITRFDLKTRFKVETMDEARKSLDSLSTIISDKSGTISIQVENRDPKFSAELANAYVGELSDLNQYMAITDAAQRRLFFEKQLVTAKDALADAEIGLQKVQEKTGMLELSGQVKGIIGNVAQLEAVISAKEVQLSAMRSFATNQNPELIRLQGEIQGYQAQLEKLKTGKLSKDGDMMVATGKIPEIGVEYIRRLRDVKYHEAMFELLSKQYELAKIDEAKESSSIQILDSAVPAEKKSKPRKMSIIVLGFVAGGLLALFLVLMRDAYLRTINNAAGKKRWDIFVNSWKNN
ncbi:GumC family protein [Janthinobacterium violaceinigrum]|uniref:Lipopolysaccharide biosynthesis protein n=1 Tax=Janthinobacterium violaceinigrum TaxID=2654252 RepID=A0A6I1I328_9BURK|nr:GNVR domain-containing protein [Janthinobacterium violaceinigrum]KAB8065344.1 hypothetical protein GCN75_08170 [Janthinobacterium violaceinigrum]